MPHMMEFPLEKKTPSTKPGNDMTHLKQNPFWVYRQGGDHPLYGMVTEGGVYHGIP